MRMIVMLALLGLGSARVSAQEAGLPDVAARARRFWANHSVDSLTALSTRVLIQLPATDPSAPVGRAQATTLLKNYLDRFEEVTVEVRMVREADKGRGGFVELGRRYRVPGTEEVRSETVLLGYQRSSEGWVLVEIRISG